MDRNNSGFGIRTLLGEKASLLDTSTLIEEPIVVHGDPKRFEALTAIPQLCSATAMMDAWDGTLKTARAWSPSGTTPFEIYPTREQLRTLYDAGFTIVLEGVESYIPRLRPFCRILETELGVAPGKVNVEAFCARQGGRGRPHFDPSFTFNCQILGTKTWRLVRNEVLRFPPTGMFLGRTPEPEIEMLLRGPLPTRIEGGEVFVAEPGSVVFVPPGVIHETHMETASFAIAFAIEETDTIATYVATEVQKALRMIPALRAPRLGAQQRSVENEMAVAANELRRIAETLEQTDDPWSIEGKRFQLVAGLSAEIVSNDSITLRSSHTSRTMTLDQAMVSILGWASGRGTFSIRDIANELSMIDPTLSSINVRKLVNVGLVEKVS